MDNLVKLDYEWNEAGNEDAKLRLANDLKTVFSFCSSIVVDFTREIHFELPRACIDSIDYSVKRRWRRDRQYTHRFYYYQRFDELILDLDNIMANYWDAEIYFIGIEPRVYQQKILEYANKGGTSRWFWDAIDDMQRSNKPMLICDFEGYFYRCCLGQA